MFTAELKVLHTGCLLVCRGEVIGSKEADYLFSLLTREDKGDVILDLGRVMKIDNEGLAVIIAAYSILSNMNRRLFLKSPSTELVHALEERALAVLFYGDPRSPAPPTGRVQ